MSIYFPISTFKTVYILNTVPPKNYSSSESLQLFKGCKVEGTPPGIKLLSCHKK